jgi:hypothetical protein
VTASHWTTRHAAAAALLAGASWHVLWRHQALAHGLTQFNEKNMVIGFTWMDSGKLYVLPFLLLMVTIVGLHRRLTAPGRSGYFVVAALASLVIGTVAEFWGFQLGSYALTFEEEVRPFFQQGWWLQALGTIFLTVALVPFAIRLVRQGILPAWMVPMMAFGALSTFFLTPAFYFPGLVWLILGLVVLRYRREVVAEEIRATLNP